MKLLKSGFEMILALIFLLYVIFVGTLSVLLNISQRHDESVTLLNEIRDLLRQNNNVDRTVSLNEVSRNTWLHKSGLSPLQYYKVNGEKSADASVSRSGQHRHH